MKKNIINKNISIFLSLAILLSIIVPCPIIKADSVEVYPYIAFGKDLNNEEKKVVIELLGLEEDELEDYKVVEVTNKDEHKYLDSYLDKSVIGSRALSSVKIEENGEENGIVVETHNISFCTEEMYTNALATAGITNASVVVAAPFKISGTAALVGAIKAYGGMTGKKIDGQKADAAMDELVTTGEVGKEIGREKAAEFVAALKEKVAGQNISSREDIAKIVDDTAKEINVSLTEEQKNKLIELMEKISKLDLNVSALKEQAKAVYDQLEGIHIDTEQAKGFLAQIAGFFTDLLKMIQNIFGK